MLVHKILAIAQVCIVLLVIAYGTIQLYKGNFEQSMVTVPFLIAYYLLLVSFQKRKRDREMNDEDEGSHPGA